MNNSILKLKNGFSLAPITDGETGERVIKELFGFYLVIAVIQGVIGAFIMRGLIWDALIFAACGFALKIWRSRLAAVVLLLMGLVTLATTTASLLGVRNMGGHNVFMAMIVAYAGVRSMQVSFALHRIETEGELEMDDIDLTPDVATGPAASAVVKPKPASMPQAFHRPEGRNIYE
jgi:hypothetical protein